MRSARRSASQDGQGRTARPLDAAAGARKARPPMAVFSRLPFVRGATLAGSLARADRQLARSVLAVFALAGVVAVLGPLLSYRSDTAQLQDLFRGRVVRQARGDANALERHLHLL